MSRVSYDTIGPGMSGKMDQEAVVFGEHIFRPELECIAVLVHYLGSSVDKKDLVLKMVACDFHLDAIEKVTALSEHHYYGFLQHIGNTLLNTDHPQYIGQALLDDFKEQCACCHK